MKLHQLAKAAVALTVAGGVMLALAGNGMAAEKKVRWKMASWFPSKLTQLGTLGRRLEDRIKLVSGGTFKIKFFEPNALIPAKGCFDAVGEGSVDACWSTTGYWYGKEPALAMFTAVPFGPAAGEYLAWFYFGGGNELMDEIYAKHGLKSVQCGIIAPEASGWFRKEINSVDDLKGLKMRFYGLGAKVMEKLGVSTQLIAGGDIFPALERGSIDATEFSMPAIDLKLGFYQIAKHYYFPGWHQQATMFELLMNKKKYEALSETHRAQIDAVCGDNIRYGLAEGEAIQGKALAELKSKGVTIHKWSPEILAKLEAAWGEVVAEHEASSPTFKKVWASYSSFRDGYKEWKDLGYLK